MAVVDGGVDAHHPDLSPPLPGGRPRVLPGYSFLLGHRLDGTAGNRDLERHGTHVAGIIAAARDNGIGIAGAAPDAQILPVRVLDEQGAGALIDVLEGIDYAFYEGADVINLSLAGVITNPQTISVIAQFLHEVRNDTSRGKPGPVIIAAAGNAGPSSPTMYPAADARVLSVGSTNARDQVTATSSRGTWLDLSAPGDAIVSTCGKGGYCTMGGTSMAAPLVAAAAAVLLQQNPGRTDVQAVLERSAYDIDGLGRDRSSGAGRLDIATAYDPVASPRVARTLTTVTGSLQSVRANGRTITAQGTARDPEGYVTIVVESSGPGGWGRRTGSSNGSGYSVSWTAQPGDHLVCTSALDNPTGRSVALGCANVLVK